MSGTSTVGGQRIHVFGASGSGTTTLGARLAAALGAPHLDTDSYYWIHTDPPFAHKRDPAARIAAIERDVAGVADWVLSGSLSNWGDPLLHRFTLALFVRLDRGVRMARLKERERARYGPRILPGGDLHTHHVAFLAWADGYDDGVAPMRSLDLHERWLARLPCPVLRLDALRPVDALCDEVLAHLRAAVETGAR